MKKTLLTIAAVAAFFFVSCGNGKRSDASAAEVDVAQVLNTFRENANAIDANEELTDEQKDAAYAELLEKTYEEHKADSAGILMFCRIAANGVWDVETVEKKYEQASDLVKGSDQVLRSVRMAKAEQATSAGQKYTDVCGSDIITGKDLSISSVLAQGKPVVVDFWASWCGPCRRAISTVLVDAAKKYAGKLNILGIAVWEKKPEDTLGAMQELGVTWPVIYDERREGGSAEQYGVLGIPTIVGIQPDGTIVARGHNAQEVLQALGFNED